MSTYSTTCTNFRKFGELYPAGVKLPIFTISGMSKAKIAPDELLKVKVIQDEYWMNTGCLPNFSLLREVYPAGLIESVW